jgi:hypothetical protein
MREGIPLRVVVIGSVIAAIAVVGGTLGYFAWLRAHMLQDAPLALAPRSVVPRFLDEACTAVDEARGKGKEAVLDAGTFEAILFPGRGGALRGEVTLDPPFARLRISQAEGDRWLNAELIVAPYALPPGAAAPLGGLGFRVLSGHVGDVSIGNVAGEWARGKIERRLAADLASNPRAAWVFAGVTDARVEARGLVLRFAPRVQ